MIEIETCRRRRAIAIFFDLGEQLHERIRVGRHEERHVEISVGGARGEIGAQALVFGVTQSSGDGGGATFVDVSAEIGKLGLGHHVAVDFESNRLIEPRAGAISDDAGQIFGDRSAVHGQSGKRFACRKIGVSCTDARRDAECGDHCCSPSLCRTPNARDSPYRTEMPSDAQASRE